MLTQTFPLELLISSGSILAGHLHPFCYLPLRGAPFLASHRTSVRFSIAVERSQLPFFWLTLYLTVFLSISIFLKNPRETLLMGRDYLLPVNFNYWVSFAYTKNTHTEIREGYCFRERSGVLMTCSEDKEVSEQR